MQCHFEKAAKLRRIAFILLQITKEYKTWKLLADQEVIFRRNNNEEFLIIGIDKTNYKSRRNRIIILVSKEYQLSKLSKA